MSLPRLDYPLPLPSSSELASGCASDDAGDYLSRRLSSLLLGAAFLIILIVLAIVLSMIWMRWRTRRQLEGGRCNLPTVVWRPRFMNYTVQDDGECEDIIDWEDDADVLTWATKFLEDNRTSESTEAPGTRMRPTDRRKKMGSSSITNILPRMERLNGPYGMYATVYGVQTKVVHVAHPVPARAILSGSGTIDTGGMSIKDTAGGGNSGGGGLFPLQWIFRVFNGASTNKSRTQKRRRSSSLRMLTGSSKCPAYDHFKNFSGEGVFTANGPDWKAKRASVMHCLLRNGATEKLLEKEINRAADSFEKEVLYAFQSSRIRAEERGCRRSPVMNVVPMLQRSTIGLVYRLITHHDVEFSPDSIVSANKMCIKRDFKASDKPDRLASSSPRSSATSLLSMVDEGTCQKEDGANYTQTSTCRTDHQQAQMMKALLPIYLKSVTKIRMIILAQSRSIWYLMPRWVYRAFSPMYRDEERTMVPIREFARLACENAVPGSPLALLSQRSSHSSEKPGKEAGRGNRTMVSKDLLDEAITLLFAGQDTSAATLSWTLHLLSLHPDKQERAADEVRAALGNSKAGPVSKNTISQMPYLDAVIKESMRLYPVAPFIVRRLAADVTIPIDDEQLTKQNGCAKTMSIPSSTFACIWIYALHRNPKLWEQPNDFLPERWIEPELRIRDSGQEVGAYMPFAYGPRNCLGQPLAHVTLRILLARILNKYVVIDPKVEALREADKAGGGGFDSKCLRKDMEAGFTVLPSNGLRIQLMER
ncbi:hypothetical protein ACHAWF_018145 [Thalassiosira exigua]